MARPIKDVVQLSDYDAVVFGSAIYAGRWLGPARDFADRFTAELTALPVWVFSSGMTGPAEARDDTPPDATTAIAERFEAVDWQSFPGKLDRDRLGPIEKMMIRAVKAPDGDYRDWDAIDLFATSIAGVLDAQTATANR
jgi:menaquinone-dependent protoporphyrinogen oxidase